MLYASPIWGKAFRISSNVHKLSAVYWKVTVRMGSAFRTVSDATVFVISGMIPIEISADEMKCIQSEVSFSFIADEEREEGEICK